MNAVAKTKTSSTLSPLIFQVLNDIRSLDALEVAELHAYAIGEAMENYSFHMFTSAVANESDFFNGSTIRSFEVFIPSWATEVEVFAEADVDGSVTSVDVDVTVGSDSDTIVLSDPWSGSVTLDVSNTGSGYQLVEIGGDATGGAARPIQVHFRVVPISASDLPDPS